MKREEKVYLKVKELAFMCFLVLVTFICLPVDYKKRLTIRGWGQKNVKSQTKWFVSSSLLLFNLLNRHSFSVNICGVKRERYLIRIFLLYYPLHFIRQKKKLNDMTTEIKQDMRSPILHATYHFFFLSNLHVQILQTCDRIGIPAHCFFFSFIG